MDNGLTKQPESMKDSMRINECRPECEVDSGLERLIQS
jgi:hypothetical protein